jgi:PAS domain S-box-containing protein
MDEGKTRQQLILELNELRRRICEAGSSKEGQLIGALYCHPNAESDTPSGDDCYRFLFEHSLDAVFLTLPDGTTKAANPAACKMFGMTKEEICRVGRQGLVDPTDPRLESSLEIRARTGEFRGELGFVRKDGSRFTAEVSSVVVKGGKKSFVILRDITELKQAEKALAASETLYRTLFQAANDAVFLHGVKPDGSPDTFIAVNDVAIKRLGFSMEEFTALTPADIDASEFAEERRKAVEIIRNEGHATFEMVHVAKDERHIPVEISTRQFVMDDKTFVLSIARDITDRKRMEEELRNSRSLLSTVIESIPFELWAIGQDGRYILVNSIVQNRYGNVVGMTPEELCAENSETLSVWQENNRRAFSGELIKSDIKFVFGGEEGTYHNIIGPIRDGDQIKGILGVNIDISQRKQMEEELRQARDELELRVQERTAELEKANDELRRIPSRLINAQEEERRRLASELHDSIGQTLAALKYRAEHITTLFRSYKIKEAVQVSDEFVPTLQRAMDETRTIYMGLRPKILEDFGAAAALKWYRDELLKLHPNQHIELDIKVIGPEIPGNLVIPIFRIAQEALNNATRHSRAEWIDLSLEMNDTQVELVISDDGRGMDLDFILESSAARSLGLISMRERTELTGGVFSIQSILGEGTTIRASWPIDNLAAIR